MDMREMVAKVKKGEPLYGESELTPYVQGMAARNSRYSSLLFHVVPFANFVHHNQVSPLRDCGSTESDKFVSMVSTLPNTTSKRNENSKRRNRKTDGICLPITLSCITNGSIPQLELRPSFVNMDRR